MSPEDAPDPDFHALNRPERGRRSFLILGLLGAAVAGAALVGVTMWLWGGGEEAPPQPGGDAATQSKPAEAVAETGFDLESTSAADAFDSDSLGIAEARLGPIARLFDAVVGATANDDRAAFLDQVDLDRFFAAMKGRSTMPRLDEAEESAARAAIEEEIFIPAPWTDYEIAFVQPQTDARFAVVFAYFWDTTGMEHQTRWWIAQRRGMWMVCDWEILDFATRASNEAAISLAFRDTAALQEYYDCTSVMSSVNTLVGQGDLEAAAALIREAEKIDPPPPLRDKTWLLLANAWARCGRTAEAMACLERIADPDALPRALLRLASCNAEWGRLEKAIDFASRYEALLGQQPELERLKSQWLLGLGRDTEAIAGLMAALDFEPDQPGLIGSLGVILPVNQKPIMGNYIAQCEEPVFVALSLAEEFYFQGDAAAIAAIGELLKEVPDTASCQVFLEALLKRLDGKLPAAAKLLEKALDEETYPAMRLAYANQYLDVMLAIGKPAEAYGGAPDPVAAFSYLGDCYLSGEYEFSDEAFRNLVAVHRSKLPDDPWVYYYAGALRAKQKLYAAAEQLFAAGMAGTTDREALLTLRDERIRNLHAAGLDLEAYEKVPPPSATFAQVSDYYCWSPKLDAEQTGTLKALVEAHRAAMPEDTWLDFCAGVVAENEGDFDAADRFFARGQQVAAADPYLAETIGEDYRERRLESRLRSGKILAALEEIPPADEAFDYLARRLSSDDKTAQLKSLIDTYRRVAADSPAVVRWQAELSWATHDYAEVVESLDSRWSGLSGRDGVQLREWLVRSHLRLGQVDEARAIAEKMYDRGDAVPLILVAATGRDVAKTRRLTAELLPSQGLINAVYFDEDVGPIVRGEEFLPLRQACPPGLRYDLSGASVVLLFKGPREADDSAIGRAMAEALGDISAEDVEVLRPAGEPAADAPTSLIVTAGERAHALTFGSDRYQLAREALHTVTTESLVRMLREQTGWLTVDASVFNQPRGDDRLAAVCRLAAGLLGDDCLAVYFPDQGRLVAVESSTAATLRSVRAAGDLAGLGEGDVWLSRKADDTEAKRLAGERQRRLPEFLAALPRRKPGEEGFLQIQLRLGPLSESHWVAVRRVIRDPFGNQRFSAMFTAPSHFAPHLKTGEPVSVEPFEITDWKIDEAP